MGSVHYSNLIEGNELPAIEAQRAVEHELDRTTKAKLELVNYVAALEWIDERRNRGEIVYSADFLKGLHGVMSRGLGRPGERFEPKSKHFVNNVYLPPEKEFPPQTDAFREAVARPRSDVELRLGEYVGQFAETDL